MKQRKFGIQAPRMPLPDYKPREPGGEQEEGSVIQANFGEQQFPVDIEGRILRKIRVDLIDPNPLAPREVYTPQMILDRAEALRTQGQHDPIHVMPNPEKEGRFIICDGWTRTLACIEHKVFDELLAQIHEDLTPEEAAWFGYQQNEEREQHCDLDRAMFYEKLIAQGMKPAEVARRAKLSKTNMTFYRSFARLPFEIIELVREEPAKFSSTIAYQLEKLYAHAGLKKTLSLAMKFAEESRTRSWLVSQIQAAMEKHEPKGPASSKQVRYANGYYKQRDNAFEVSIEVDAAKRKEFADALEALLATVGKEVPPAAEGKSEPPETSEEDVS